MLVITQFTISGSLFIAVLLMAQQVNYLRSKNLGFEKDNIINVELRGSDKASVFASLLRQIPQVKDFSFTTAPPSSAGHWGTLMSFSDGGEVNQLGVTTIMADERYCPMYELQLLSGRLPQVADTNSIARSLPKEQQLLKVVVNEQLVKSMGIESNEAALGHTFWCGINDGDAEIIGVVADFNATSLRDAIKPAVITIYPQFYTQAGIQIEANSNIPQTLAAIETAWKMVFPDGVFEFTFLDEQIDAFYTAETRLYTLFKIFAGLAILISCLGLWGLSSYAAEQRTKEIGIRKVLGASVNAIVLLLSKDFLLMVIIALVISSPIAYFLMSDWLQHFAYRIEIGWQVFVLVGIVSVLIALLTVSFQTLRAALANPVNSLRNE